MYFTASDVFSQLLVDIMFRSCLRKSSWILSVMSSLILEPERVRNIGVILNLPHIPEKINYLYLFSL